MRALKCGRFRWIGLESDHGWEDLKCRMKFGEKFFEVHRLRGLRRCDDSMEVKRKETKRENCVEQAQDRVQ